MQIQKINTANSSMNHNKHNCRNVQKTFNEVTFCGGNPGGGNFFNPLKKIFSFIPKSYNNIMDKLSVPIAKGFTKFLELKPTKSFVNLIKKSNNLVSHLNVLTSIVLSSFYMIKTLKNDEFEPERKKTLAINQAGTCILSTILAYSFDKLANNKIDEFTNKFMAANLKNELVNNLSDQIKVNKNLSNYKAGIKAAKSIMIFGTVYRFISPVLITPISNTISNKLNEKQKSNVAKN